MKIVQIITRMDDVGGAQIHVRDIVEELQNSGHQIYLITGDKENIHKEIEGTGTRLINSQHLIRNLSPVSDIKAILELRKYLKEIKPDLVATHSSKAGIVGRIAGWSLGIPTIFTAHGWAYTDGVSPQKRKLYILIEKMTGWISKGVITVSDYDQKLALKHKVLPQRKMLTIHNGVHDIEMVTRKVCDKKIPQLIMVARFAPPKQQLQLLKVLNDIRDIPWQISFAGDGPQLAEAKSFVKVKGLEERVSFLGNRSDVECLLEQADLFVLISNWEGLPLSVLEAMRCGLPIIASDVGGVKEAVKDSRNGFLIPKHHMQLLRKRLVTLLSDSDVRLKMGKESREIYQTHFKFEKMYEKTVTFYEQLVQTNTNGK